MLGTLFHEGFTGDPRVEQLRHRPMDPDLPHVVYGQGDLFYKNGGRYRVGYTMLETSGIPEEWVRQCNAMDEVWVPSEFNRQTFMESGVTRPIEVMPLGVNPHQFHPDIDAERFSSRYTFLSVFEWGERKNPASLLRAFCRAFAPDDDVALVIKYSMPMLFDRQQFLKELNLPDKTPPITFLQSKSIAYQEMGSLYRGADCFVSTTHGEGWGMPMLEAMACGLPTIATNWSAHTMFMNEQNSYPVPVDPLIPAVVRCPYYEGFSWAQIDEDALAERMRHINLHPNEAKRKGMSASKEVREKWTWEKSAACIEARIRQWGI